MTFAVITWLSISINLILVIFVIVCFLMILIILMQRPKQEGLGAAFGGGVTDQVFGARTTNVLQRGTVYLGSLFFILSLALAVLIGQKNRTVSLLDKQPSSKVTPAVPVPPVENLTPNSLKDELPPEETPVVVPTPAESPADAPGATTPSVEPAPVAPSAPLESTPEIAAPPQSDPPASQLEDSPGNKPKEP